MNEHTKTVNLPRGKLSLTYSLNNENYQLDDLLGFAERINPKRSFLFVSKVLGRHIPVKPTKIRQAFSDLAKQVTDNFHDLPQPILVLGMAETAVGLSAGFHQALQKKYPQAILLNSTRHAQNAPLFAQFSEDHSHASQHLIYQSEDKELQKQVLACKTLIMVDDEASTGQTCQNVVNALRQAGLSQLQQVHLATLVDWSLHALQKNPFSDIDFYRHYLMAGSWQWQEKTDLPPVTMPNVATTKAGSQPLLNTENWGRKPTLDSTTGLPYLIDNLLKKVNVTNLQDKKILVLGSNEFVWLPFLLAEWLQDKADLVKFSSLTRSPIQNLPQSLFTKEGRSPPFSKGDLGGFIEQDYAIKAKFTFKDNYGLGMTNFVYNVVAEDWDMILLCIETAETSIDTAWQTFNNLLVVSPE